MSEIALVDRIICAAAQAWKNAALHMQAGD